MFADDLRAGAPLRWPFYTPCALEFGARAVFALPLQVGAARLGVLGLYSDRPGGLPDHALTRALAFADVATEAVLDGESLVDEGLAADALDETIGHSWDVYQAQGMVMAQLGTDIVDAMVRLRAHAHTNHCRLDDVAGDIVTGRLTLAALTRPDSTTGGGLAHRVSGEQQVPPLHGRGADARCGFPRAAAIAARQAAATAPIGQWPLPSSPGRSGTGCHKRGWYERPTDACGGR